MKQKISSMWSISTLGTKEVIGGNKAWDSDFCNGVKVLLSKTQILPSMASHSFLVIFRKEIILITPRLSVRFHVGVCRKHAQRPVPTGYKGGHRCHCLRMRWQSREGTLTFLYTGWGCWGGHLSAGKFQNKAYYTFSELCRTDHHNNHHPGRQQRNQEKHQFLFAWESKCVCVWGGLFLKACFLVSGVGGSMPRDCGWGHQQG